MKKLSALTGIRFIAAFYVFIFHINLRIPFKFPMHSLQSLIAQGAIGVNVFFVLSGFILTYTYQHKIGNKVPKGFYKEFILKRLIRIYPAYLVGFVLSIIITAVFHYPLYLRILFLDATMLESYFPSYAMQWYGGGGWSISTEFFFYFTFPFLIPFFLKFNKQGLKMQLALAVTGSFLFSLLFHLIPNTISYKWLYTFPVSRLFEFISGVVASLLVFRYDWRIKEGIAITGILILAAYFAKFGGGFEWITVHNFLVVPETIAVLVVCVRAEKTLYFKFLGSRVMVYLGEISYGFYILQLPILLTVDYLLMAGKITHTDYWLIPVLFAVNLIASALMYKYIEHPVHLYFNNRMKEKKLLRESKSIQPA